VRPRALDLFCATNSAAECREAMGIDWMDRATLVQAVPPDYAEHIGRAALEPHTSPEMTNAR
jgi:hypothetical protein